MLPQKKASKRLEKQELEVQRKNSMLIDEGLREERRKMEEYRKEPKILILGSSDSGKSTLLKQFKILHCDGFTSDEKSIVKYQIYKNLIVAAITLVALAECDASDSTFHLNQSFVSDAITSFTSSFQIEDSSPLEIQEEDSLGLAVNSPLVKVSPVSPFYAYTYCIIEVPYNNGLWRKKPEDHNNQDSKRHQSIDPNDISRGSYCFHVEERLLSPQITRFHHIVSYVPCEFSLMTLYLKPAQFC